MVQYTTHGEIDVDEALGLSQEQIDYILNIKFILMHKLETVTLNDLQYLNYTTEQAENEFINSINNL